PGHDRESAPHRADPRRGRGARAPVGGARAVGARGDVGLPAGPRPPAGSGAAGGEDLLRARRFLLVDGFSVAAVLAAGRNARASVRGLLLTLLLAGNAWTLWELARFVTAPRGPTAFTLPGVFSAESVGLVDRPAVAWAEGLARRARAGERLVVLQSQACPTEGFTNPTGVLERLYLRLGH